MCGLVGYIGKNLSRAYVLQGLARLEYRGYDSAGFACLNPVDHRLIYLKTLGQLQNLVKQFEEKPIDGYVGIGHTRWSTHGIVSQENAHPQFDCNKTLSIAHNGIIENFHELKSKLIESGHIFHSQTDTEVVAHLFEALLKTHITLKAALMSLVNQLEGAYALVVIMQSQPDNMVVIRKGSPLCLGIGNDEMFVASDLLAFADSTNKVVFLPDKSFAIVRKNSLELYDFTGNEIPITVQEVTVDSSNIEKKGYEHFMLKEIYEQKTAIHASLNFFSSLRSHIWDQLGISATFAQSLESITFLGCGTSWHAARIGQFFFEKIALMPAKVMLASEFRYMPFFSDPKSLYIAISQSGETADTLEALRLINSLNLSTVALTNVASSTMVREAGGFLLTHAGQEIAVASTKAFTTQLAALYWLANRIALEKGIITSAKLEQAEEELLVAAEILENSIENYKQAIVSQLAPYYAQFKRAIFLGRHISYPFALEAALKLKEISYIFAQSYPAGELKHGPIALIDAQTPIFLFSSLDKLVYQKLLSNAQEVKARQGHLVVFAFEDQHELISLADCVFVFPKVNPLLGPLVMTGVMQFLIYHIAKVLDCPIDKPRNLAKSVTVE